MRTDLIPSPIYRLSRPFCALIALMVVAPMSSFASTVLTASQTSINFGSWPVGGGGHAVYETLTNKGTTAIKVTHYYINGQFTTFDLSYPFTLNPGASFTFKVKYVPTTAGAATGKLMVTSNAPTVAVALSGTGTSTGSLTVSPTSYSFGNVTVGTTASLTATLKAGTSSLSISKATTTNSEFTLSGLTLPLTLAAGKSLAIKINFKPTASGSASAQISLTSGLNTVTASASGSGVATTQHKVNLSWSASSSSVAGYNVYRGTAAGGPYSKLNSTSLVSTSYSDATVGSGKTYYYVTTSVSSSGTESTQSNEAKAAIPTP